MSLITIKDENGKAIKLYGLLKAAQCNRNNWKMDSDYINSLVKMLANEKTHEEARKALLFLNAYYVAELGANLGQLENLSHVSDEIKKDLYLSHNSGQRDLFSKNRTDLEGLIESEAYSIGGLVDSINKLKRSLRKKKKSIKQFRNDLEPKKIIITEEED